MQKYRIFMNKQNYRIMKRTFLLLSIIATMIAFLGCEKEEDVIIYELSTPDSVFLKVGESKSITAKITPGRDDIKDLIWKSTDKSIAFVNIHEDILGIAEGEVIISVSSKELNASSSTVVIVSPIKAEKISLNTNNLLIEEGKTFKLTATVVPNNTTNKTIKWETSDSNIATVSEDGDIEAISEGNCKITAAVDEQKAVCDVIVTPIKVQSVSLSTTNFDAEEEYGVKTLALLIGETDILKATVLPSNAKNTNVKWISKSPEYVSINANGTIKALKANDGFVEILVETEDGGKTDLIQIKPRTIESFVHVITSSTYSSINHYVTGSIGSVFMNSSRKPVRLSRVQIISNKTGNIVYDEALNKVLDGGYMAEKELNVSNEYKPDYKFVWYYKYGGKLYKKSIINSL